jgi:hypothetical protein
MGTDTLDYDYVNSHYTQSPDYTLGGYIALGVLGGIFVLSCLISTAKAIRYACVIVVYLYAFLYFVFLYFVTFSSQVSL